MTEYRLRGTKVENEYILSIFGVNIDFTAYQQPTSVQGARGSSYI